jgi:hypothetical protein
MARVEILMLDQPPTFTVDISQVEVNAAGAANPGVWYGFFQNGIPRHYFREQEHIKLLSIMLRLPYCFHVSTGISRFVFAWNEFNGNSSQTLTEIGGLGWINIPLSGIEIGIGDIKAAWDGQAPVVGPGNKARIGLRAYDLNISMIGVPASLDQTDQQIQIALKILHTQDMIA